MSINTNSVATKQYKTTSKEYFGSIEDVSRSESPPKINTKFLAPATPIPNHWVSVIQDKYGNYDVFAALVMAELVGTLRYLSSDKVKHNFSSSFPQLLGKGLLISYEFLCTKCGSSKDKIYRAIKRLAQLKLLSYETRNVQQPCGKRINKIFVSIEHNFYADCFRDPKLDIRVAENFEPCPQICSDHISNENNIYKNRSIKSSFLNKLFLEKVSKKSPEEKQQPKFTEIKLLESRKLEEFYPLSDSDISELQSSSGRNFTKRAMNEILKDMAKRVTSAEFYSKKGFMSYMSKAFKYEKRNELLVSSDSFYIKNNLTPEEQRTISQEKYLSEVEYSLEVNPEAHLRKKLAAVLERSKACEVLRGWKSARRVGDIFEITLSKPVILTRMDREIIHNSVLATAPQAPGETIACIERTEIIMPNAKLSQNSNQIHCNQEKDDPEDYLEKALPDNAWGRIRKKLITESGSNVKFGIGIDSAWFSKLKENVDEQAKSISLKAPSEFVRDWISSKYMIALCKTAESIGYSVKQIE